jgi:hypothetical protein
MSSFAAKVEAREALKKNVEEFMANGGKITKVKTKPDPSHISRTNEGRGGPSKKKGNKA